jgi:hypothetical protein
MESRIIVLVSLAAMICSCNLKRGTSQEANESLKQEYLARGREIVMLSQAELLKNVAGAMGSGGPQHAVDFCNVHALSIKDSLSALYRCEIRRIAPRYRNPLDKPVTGSEKEAVSQFREAALAGDTLQARVYLFEDRVEYYHPILINNPTCLLCHGIPGEQIGDRTMEMIRTHYPGDLATGFKIGDFRGVWKITFNNQE